MKKILKVGLGGDLLACLAAAARSERVAEAELVRRALWLYFSDPAGGPRPGAGTVPGATGGAGDEGPDQALPGPGSGPCLETGGGSPPSSPLHSPSPPSVSPPLPPEQQVGASPAAPAASGPPAGPPGDRDQLPLWARPSSRQPSGPDEVVLRFPCIRHSRPHPGSGELEWPLTRRQLERWEGVFPDMDVLGEMRKAREYLTLRPERRKTARGMPRCLFGWLSRGQDGGRYLRRSDQIAPGRSAGAAIPGAGTLFDEYGFESWEQWEAKLRATLTGATLDEALGSLEKLRRRWDAGRAAGEEGPRA